MTNQAEKLQEIVKNKHTIKNPKTKFIAVTSGKGGVGKSTISANMANVLASYGYKVCIFDADIGLANLDVMFNVRAKKNILHVLKGEAGLKDIIIPVAENLLLIPGESGDEILKYNDQFIHERFLEEAKVLDDIDFMIIDTGAGIGNDIQVFLNASDEVIVVTVPDPAAITDAYATIKITSKMRNNIFMVLNMVKNANEAQVIFEKIKKVAQSNIGSDLTLEMLGKITNDKSVIKSIKQRTLITREQPNSFVSMDIQQIVKNLVYKMERKVLDDKKEGGFGNFIKRLMEQF
jgi:flagellar biosynthesis protein FlhG